MNINLVSSSKLSNDYLLLKPEYFNNHTSQIVSTDFKTFFFFPFILAFLSSGPFLILLIETVIKIIIFEALKLHSSVDWKSLLITEWKTLISSAGQAYIRKTFLFENATTSQTPIMPYNILRSFDQLNTTSNKVPSLETPIMPYTIMRLRYQQRTSHEMSFDINAYSCKLKIQSSSPKPNQEKSCIVTTVNELLSSSISAASLSTNTVLSSKQSPTICPSSENNLDAYILTFGVDKFTP